MSQMGHAHGFEGFGGQLDVGVGIAQGEETPVGSSAKESETEGRELRAGPHGRGVCHILGKLPLGKIDEGAGED